jgi:hypothetical protein
MSKLAGLAFLSSALWVVSATAQVREEFSVPVDYQGGQIQLRAEFQKPATGAGPFPAIIALHACGGYNDPYSITTWLPLLWQQGYATLRLDSFTARGHYGDICGNIREVTTVERATDALAAAYVLAGRRMSGATASRSLVGRVAAPALGLRQRIALIRAPRARSWRALVANWSPASIFTVGAAPPSIPSSCRCWHWSERWTIGLRVAQIAWYLPRLTRGSLPPRCIPVPTTASTSPATCIAL